ncbi:MAG: PT domain-containing protein [Planctomycetaceae bacterium]|nr:PT domain-containing protein [Planctomycetaceae bacterium]
MLPERALLPILKTVPLHQPSNHPTIQPSNHPIIQPSNHPTIQSSNHPTPLPAVIPARSSSRRPSCPNPTICWGRSPGGWPGPV